METLIGIKGKEYFFYYKISCVIIAADSNASYSFLNYKQDEDKVFFIFIIKQIVKIDNRKILALAGDAGDRVVFSEYIQKNLTLFRLRNSYEESTHSAAHFIRKEVFF